MAIITINNDLYMKGSNKSGQLGLPSNILNIEDFTLIKNDVSKVTCYQFHTFYIDTNFDAYSVGVFSNTRVSQKVTF